MQSIKVSTCDEVFEQFRRSLVTDLRGRDVAVPSEADTPGRCYDAVAAWVRLQHRSVPAGPRTVLESPELLGRDLPSPIRASVAAIRLEFEQGDDPTHRLTRQFYKAGFNDFLFNTFGIHHIHLGLPGAAQDKTRKHTMAGGEDALLFTMARPEHVYFLDVLDHDVFESPDMTKSLLQVALRHWPELLRRYMLPGVIASDLSFETAFKLAKAGATTIFEVDGVFLASGNVLDGKVTNGKRAACTSTEVTSMANRIMNLVRETVDFVARDPEKWALAVEQQHGKRPLEFKLEVVYAGQVVVLRESTTGAGLFHNGRKHGLLPATT